MKRQKRVYFSKTELSAWIEAGRLKTHDEIVSESRAIHVKKGSAR
jgi:hypothetical protein